MTAMQTEDITILEMVEQQWRGLTVMDRLYGPTVRNERGCILRTSGLQSSGYTHIRYMGQVWRAHRLAWEFARGPLGDLTIDHLCKQLRCVNVAHLEAVTLEENSRRRHGWIDGTCGKGHDITDPANVMDMGKHRRRCRPCWNSYNRERRAS